MKIANKLFDYSLEKLNKQIIAYTTCAKDDRCFRVTKEMLSYNNSYEFSKFRGKTNRGKMFMLHMDVPYKKRKKF